MIRARSERGPSNSIFFLRSNYVNKGRYVPSRVHEQAPDATRLSRSNINRFSKR